MGTKIEIHNGNQIGGCITVISTQQAKIVIDFGEQLPGAEATLDYEFDWDKERVDAVLFTHYHGDHIGRFKEIPKGIPLYMGEVTKKIMATISKHIHDDEALKILESDRIKKLTAKKTFFIGDMKITPYTVDHSAYDAYMILVETPDKTILHTGDFRGHGHRGKALLPMINSYILRNGRRKVDILITEGTMMNRTSEEVYSEKDMLKDAKKLFKEHKHVFLICSSTNLDSLATFYQAAKENHIKMYSTDYVKEQLNNFSNTAGEMTKLYDFQYAYAVRFNQKIPLPQKTVTQQELMRDEGFLIIIKAEEKYKKWIDKFADLNPVVVYSMWKGYLDPKHNAYNPEWKHFWDSCKNKKIMHTSGHATADVLAAVIDAVDPQEAIIPIHTENARGFKDLNIREELKRRIKIEEEGTYE